ncbi:MAG: bacterial/archaeal transporter family-2 protein [Thermoleophilaceae bacterium]|nr:bacterial/archaeal transporter family-2 protein [Thermoleophilaceae bacterium]MEA2368510.1 bacterial/archaeal transporter family-2 protein [Thermoleophilaceae bacterium]
MKPGIAIALTAGAGGLVAMQAPINGMLGRHAGKLAAASISFVIGTAVLVAITLVSGSEVNLSGAVKLPWYYFLGGVLGAAYVTTVLTTVRSLGAGGVTAATIAGQLTASVVLDRVGAFGLPEKQLTIARVVGVALLAGGVFLIVRD